MVALRNEAQFMRDLLRDARPRRLRTMLEFAEQELIMPDGPFEGQRFSADRQPYSKLWFDAVDSGDWTRFVATGPSQSGKTWHCYVVPILYHLFEYEETVIGGLPDLAMAEDKWGEDILPAIMASRYRHLAPKSGRGSKGGFSPRIEFGNGATLRFMGGGGGDKQRSAFTSRVLVITETDGLEVRSAGSVEADKIRQMFARVKAFGSRARIYMECTVTTKKGRTWKEYTEGSQSRIAMPCQACKTYVTLDREHLVGWQDADDVIGAQEEARWVCPECGVMWEDEERDTACRESILLHRGQTAKKTRAGRLKVAGDAPRTDTLGFRWSAPDNMFTTAGEVAGEEWRAARAEDPDDAEREMRQFIWAIPIEAAEQDLTSLQAHALIRRMTSWGGKGLVPDGVEWLTVGVDLGLHLCHWAAIAWWDDASGLVIDYGRLDVPSEDFGAKRALMAALRSFRDEQLVTGWARSDGTMMTPDGVWVDSGWEPEPAYQLHKESDSAIYMPTKGYGATNEPGRGSGAYHGPDRRSKKYAKIGQNYHITRLQAKKVRLVHVDADHWKTQLHERLAVPVDRPGAIRFYNADPREHHSIASHICAEKKYEEFDPKRGIVTKWKRISKKNHFLDTLYLACAAAHHAGVRLIVDEPPAEGGPTKAKKSWYANQKRRESRR